MAAQPWEQSEVLSPRLQGEKTGLSDVLCTLFRSVPPLKPGREINRPFLPLLNTGIFSFSPPPAFPLYSFLRPRFVDLLPPGRIG